MPSDYRSWENKEQYCSESQPRAPDHAGSLLTTALRRSVVQTKLQTSEEEANQRDVMEVFLPYFVNKSANRWDSIKGGNVFDGRITYHNPF
jgi:hypothetical protein